MCVCVVISQAYCLPHLFVHNNWPYNDAQFNLCNNAVCTPVRGEPVFMYCTVSTVSVAYYHPATWGQ